MKLHKLSKNIIALLSVSVMIFSGCQRNADDFKPSDLGEEIEQGQNPIETPPETDPDGPGLMAIGERYEKDGKMESYLTGEWVDLEVATRRPMAVMIPNNKSSLPQYGIGRADIVYEAPMEKCSCTRLMGVFQNFGDLEYIEPVRSSRHYFLMEALSFDAIYCNWGLAVPYVGPLINSDFVDNVSASVAGINVGADEAFSRDKERQDLGYSLEYTGVMSLDGYNAAVSRLGYDTKYPTSNFDAPFQFATDSCRAEYEDAVSATKIWPGGNANQGVRNGYQELNPYFEYNEEDSLYYRFQNDKPQMDEYDDKQVAVTNVIIKYVDGEYLDDDGYLSFTTFGTGDGILFTNGKMINLEWERAMPVDEELNYTDGIYAQTRFYDKETGDELILNKGKTWICLVWKEYSNYTIIQ